MKEAYLFPYPVCIIRRAGELNYNKKEEEGKVRWFPGFRVVFLPIYESQMPASDFWHICIFLKKKLKHLFGSSKCSTVNIRWDAWYLCNTILYYALDTRKYNLFSNVSHFPGKVVILITDFSLSSSYSSSSK